MAGPTYTEYEYRMAMALSSHPGLVALDTTNTSFMSLVPVKQSDDSSWELSSFGNEVTPAEDFDDSTVQADVYYVFLSDPNEARTRNRPFKFKSAIRVVSTRLTGVMPSANVIMVPDFPLTEQVVIDVAKQHLLRTEYARESTQFLWGPEVIDLREEE